MGEDSTGQLRPAKRQRTLNQLEGDAIGRQLSESGNSVARVLMEDAGAPSRFGPAVGSPFVLPAEDYDQGLLWAIMEDAGPSSSREPTARHHQSLDLGEAVRSFNSRHGDQHAPAALDSSSVPPSQDSCPTRFVVHNDRYTALFVPATEMRRTTPLNPPGAGIRLGSRPENVPQPSARPANRASPARLGRSMEQAAPSSARAATTSPTAREIYAASFAVPEDFSHGTQPASATMLSKLGRWGLLPDAAQPVKQYDIRGERYFAIMGREDPMTFGSSMNHEWRRRTLPTLGARPDSFGIGLVNGRWLTPATLTSLATLWAVQMSATRPDELAHIIAQRLRVQPKAIASCYLRAGHQSCKETPNGTFGGITLRKALSSPEIWEASSE
ncbi:hypothetical protein [Bradyrhizobium pachyrhizi]|uniref:hypothetical protein n=1 Tax=Bradyrhizobium pachyrhizi TaxID=280333 RepID=UPI0018DF8C1C|nr:hypothetical protein [Bradyrhizobium pachyrhizi]